MGNSRRWGPPWEADRRTGRFADPAGFRRAHRSHLGPVLTAGLIQVISGAAADLRPLAMALLVAGPLALLWRHRFPLTVFVVSAAATLGVALLAAPRWVYAVAPPIALFTLARLGRPRAAAVGAALGYAAYLGLWTMLDVRPGVRELVLLAVGLAMSIFLGGAAKTRAEHMAEMMKVRAERARAREEQERRQASEERLRMAQELHDVLGHHLSLINVQAGVGLHLMDNRPEQAREALTAIKAASAEALREVRAVLGVLRTEGEAAPRQPTVGLSRLDALTADAGLPVTTAVTGEPRELPPEVDRAAYRIIQEALTNVRKHASSAATATVAVDYLPTALHLAIRNDGVLAPDAGEGTGDDGAGTGIGGMRARARSLGGSLEAGPVEGGFLVSVLLPTGEKA